MANIRTDPFKKFMAVGCNHGIYACKNAQDAVLGFRERYKPEIVIDLGDVYDFTAFRGGAKGSKDESSPIDLDFNSGSDWLRRYRPTHRCNGNHDHRIYKLLDHPNAIVAHCAAKVVEDVRQVDEENGTIVKPYKRNKNWFKFGDTLVGHGFMFAATAMRDHAEHFGKCIIAHLHTPGQVMGRRSDHPMCTCVGTLADPDELEYADTRRNTDTWGHGLVHGEFNSKETIIRLETQRCGHGEFEAWRLPI